MPAKFLAVLIAPCLLLTLAACAGNATSPAAPAVGPASTGEIVFPGETLEPATPTVAPTFTPTLDPAAWQPVELPDAGLQLIAPPGWQALEDGGYWSDDSGARISVSVMDLPAGANTRGAFLPEEFELVQTRSLSTGLGMGECLLIAITRHHGQSSTIRYEWHILVNSGDHPAVDFYASTSSMDALVELRPQLERLAKAAAWLP